MRWLQDVADAYACAAATSVVTGAVVPHDTHHTAQCFDDFQSTEVAVHVLKSLRIPVIVFQLMCQYVYITGERLEAPPLKRRMRQTFCTHAVTASDGDACDVDHKPWLLDCPALMTAHVANLRMHDTANTVAHRVHA
jgi:hypothetical protein